MKPFYYTYNMLLSEIMGNGVIERNVRTGAKIKVLPGGRSFSIDLSSGYLPVTGTRKLFPRSAAAELAWFIQGTKDSSFIKKYAPIWDKFTEDDGITIDSAYGYRWAKHFGRDQLMDAVEALRKNPTDRRIYISAWDPAIDGLGRSNQKNVPCPTSFTLNIVDGKLHSSYFLRSSDVFVGLPYDIMCHSLLLTTIAAELNVELGTLHVTLAHAHIYDAHWSLTEHILESNNELVETKIPMPKWYISAIYEYPDDYVKLVGSLSKSAEWPKFNPKPEVIE